MRQLPVVGGGGGGGQLLHFVDFRLFLISEFFFILFLLLKVTKVGSILDNRLSGIKDGGRLRHYVQ